MGSAGTEGEPNSLNELLDRIEEAAKDEDDVSLDDLLDEVGRRSYGPLLLLAGLITLAPVVGDIPGVPTIVGIFVLLTGVQLVFQRDHFWLPGWLLKRTIHQEKLCKAVGWMRKPAGWLDRVMKRRLSIVISGAMAYVVAIVCVGIALVMPLMEVVPFSANLAGAALTAFGLALIAHDGLVALFAFAFTIAGGIVVGLNLP